MSKIIVGINTLSTLEQPVYANHCQFWYRLGRETNHDFFFNAPRRQSIDRMRNITAKTALEQGCDYILFIDDDVVIQLDALQKLISCNADIAAGWTLIRGYPFENMFFRFIPGDKTALKNVQDEDVPLDNSIISVDAVGFSCCLIKVDLVRKLQPPYFVTGPYNTEDIYFCMKAQQEFPDTKIVVHTGIKTSHNLGPEFLDPLNKKFYKQYMEALEPSLLKSNSDENLERGDKYLESLR